MTYDVMLIAMVGLPGTGKSTLAQALMERLGAVVLDKDEVRASLFPPDAIEYSTAQDDLCVDVMLQVAGYLLQQVTTRPVIVDGRTFSRAYQAAVVVEAARAIQTPLTFIRCVCADALALARLNVDQTSGAHPAKNRDAALYHTVKARFEPLTVPHLTVDTAQALGECVDQCYAYVPRNP